MKNKEIEELLKNCKIWVKTDDIDYTRWFGLYELSLLLSYIEQLQNNRDKAIEYINKNIAIYHKQLPLIAIDYEEVINILKGGSDE